MATWKKLGVCLISVLLLLSLLVSYYFTSTNSTTENFKSKEDVRLHQSTTKKFDGDFKGVTHLNHLPPRNKSQTYKTYYRNWMQSHGRKEYIPTEKLIENILNHQRDEVAREMMHFEYPSSQKLSDLTLETNGSPYRSIIFTTWRSGSTFFGEILNAIPGTFYHYEPLFHYGITQIREEPHATEAISHLKRLLQCNYTEMEKYFKTGMKENDLFQHTTRLWHHCCMFLQDCLTQTFFEPFCKLFPLQSMKIVRLRVAFAQALLDDSSLNVKVILLIRDPRGIMQSRRHRKWCHGEPDCDDVSKVCADMVADFRSAQNLTKSYPDRFAIVRYEDLSLNPYVITEEILDFYGLPMDEHVESYLDVHTKYSKGGVSSTFRDSKSAPFHWMKDLKFSEISHIQNACSEAMAVWGYKLAKDANDLKNNFQALLPYKLS